jgi:hypothetical protein
MGNSINEHNMNTTKISIAKNFSEAPAGRYLSDGPFSGEKFRDEVLFPAFSEFDLVEVDLDGTLGYGSSFLEEVFGGLIRERGMTLEQINKKLVIFSSRRLYLARTKQYMIDAENRRHGK